MEEYINNTGMRGPAAVVPAMGVFEGQGIHPVRPAFGGAFGLLNGVFVCVCVWTISKDVKLVTHHGQDPYPFLLPFLWSGIVVLQNWAGPLPSL